MPIKAEQAPSQGESPFQPSQPPPFLMEEFQGLYTSTTRPGVKDEQCWWIDGFIPLGRNDLRTLPGSGPVVFTTPSGKTISFFDFANIGATPYAIVIGATGEIYAVNTTTGGFSTIAPAGTDHKLVLPERRHFPHMAASTSSDRQLEQTNGYFIRDGTTFYVPGRHFGGGTIPTAIGGTAIETYAGRIRDCERGRCCFWHGLFQRSRLAYRLHVWRWWSEISPSTDSFLEGRHTLQLIQTNGFLYLIGDSSINYISGVQTAGSPRSRHSR